MALAALAPPATAWQYLDEARTHAVAAALLDDRLVVKEWAQGAFSQQVFPVRAPWEAQLALWTLEARLVLLGAYWRRVGGQGGWVKIGPPRGAPVPDLRASEIVPGIVLHHYHDPAGRLDELVAALPQRGRYHLVRAELELPALDVGRIRLLHADLVEPLMRSALVHEQVVRVHEARPKLVTRADYERAFGWSGAERVQQAVEEVSGRFEAREWERPPPRAVEPDVFDAFLVVVNDPRLGALHARYLVPSEEAELLEGGAPLIRRYVAAKRAQAPHHEQHLLTLLEASLLARERMRSGQLTRWDPEVRALTRLAYYL